MAQTLASVDDVSTYMQDDSLDSDAVEQALAYATAIIQAATGQRLFYVQDDVQTLRWPRQPYIILPERPVIDVSKIEFVPASGPVQTIDDQETFNVEPDGRVTLVNPWEWRWSPSSWRGSVVRATYSHGWQVVPADLSAVAIGLAVRTLHKPTETYSEDLGNFTQPTSTAGPAQLSKIEREIVNRYRTTTRSMVG